jgi:hypothetical protein
VLQKSNDERHLNIATKLYVSNVMEGNKSCQNMHRLKSHKAGSGIQTAVGEISFMPEEIGC